MVAMLTAFPWVRKQRKSHCGSDTPVPSSLPGSVTGYVRGDAHSLYHVRKVPSVPSLLRVFIMCIRFFVIGFFFIS